MIIPLSISFFFFCSSCSMIFYSLYFNTSHSFMLNDIIFLFHPSSLSLPLFCPSCSMIISLSPSVALHTSYSTIFSLSLSLYFNPSPLFLPLSLLSFMLNDIFSLSILIPPPISRPSCSMLNVNLSLSLGLDDIFFSL